MFYEEQIASETRYEGIIVNVRRDKAKLNNGKIAEREVVEHPGGVGIVAVTDSGEIVLVRQYRYAVSTELLEIPAGKLEHGEDPLQCAKRELSEETGYTAKQWREVVKLRTSPGFCEETLHIYLATGLKHGTAHPDEDEFLNIEHVNLDVFWEKIINGEITDAKTAAGTLIAREMLKA